VLGFFARHPASTQSALSRKSGRDKAQLTRLIATLRERGLLSGEADPGDRRNTLLSLTDAGADMLEQIRLSGEQLNAQALQGISAQQQEGLQALLLQMKDNLDKTGRKEKGPESA
jgi:DNA-binding MarR family transcriptional regulator